MMAAAPVAEAAAGGSAAAAGGSAAGRAAGGAGGLAAAGTPGSPNMGRRKKKKPTGSGSTPRTKPEHIPTTDEVNDGVTSADLEARDAAAPAPTSSGAGVRLPNAGGGLVLGSLAYVLGLTYLRGGRAGVKALLRAKFFNQVGG
jgi:hypothetical protein